MNIKIVHPNTIEVWVSNYTDINPTSHVVLYFARSLSDHYDVIVPIHSTISCIDPPIKCEVKQEQFNDSTYQCSFCHKMFHRVTILRDHFASYGTAKKTDDVKPFVSKIKNPVKDPIVISDKSDEEMEEEAKPEIRPRKRQKSFHIIENPPVDIICLSDDGTVETASIPSPSILDESPLQHSASDINESEEESTTPAASPASVVIPSYVSSQNLSLASNIEGTDTVEELDDELSDDPSLIQMSFSDDDDLTVDNHGNRVINSNTLKKLPLQEVYRVPSDIDGACAYSLSASSLASLHEKCRDGRPWKKDSGTKWKDYDKVRYKNCKGSLKCSNLHCAFLVQYLTENQLKFDKNQMCTLCGAQGVPYCCAARKYTAIKDVAAHIYHKDTTLVNRK